MAVATAQGRPLVRDAAKAHAAQNRLVLAHIYTSTIALAVGALFGLLQGFSRANWLVIPQEFDYYRVLTVHGVLMALVFTTFFITGLAMYGTYRVIERERTVAFAWISYALMLGGTVLAAYEILIGNATVLYTFYAPLKADPLFYFGATFLVLGTWGVAFEVFENVVWWVKQNPGKPIPLPMHGITCTFAMWIIATLGVVAEMCMLIPWSMDLTPGINVMVSRMLFWYFGHPLVYFWVMGAYLIWYNVIPVTYKGKNFSDPLTRLAFIMLLLLSTPVGLHHEFLEPGVSAFWKWVHTVTTYGVVIPSFMTAFALFASFELAARAQGRTGFWNVIRGLPWRDPAFSGAGLGMLLFIFGGAGGIINSSYSLDVLVHNTMWIVGHFHVTVGGPVALTFIAATYRLVPSLTGRRLWAPKLALAQTYLYFVGMFLMSMSMHVAGLLGSPRRTADVTYFGAAGAQSWHGEMVLAAVGGTILFVSILMFVAVALGTRFVNTPRESTIDFAPTETGSAPSPLLDRIGLWSVIALALAILAYAGPLNEVFSQHGYLVKGMRTW
jgi:cytochrome c oxidase subunit 1